jgi:hypothetical protein
MPRAARVRDVIDVRTTTYVTRGKVAAFVSLHCVGAFRRAAGTSASRRHISSGFLADP